MIKKTLGLVITSIMLLGVFGLTACSNDTLDAYKVDGKTAIQTYADAKGQDNYCADNWTAICGIVTAGKQAVDEATSKAGVDTVVATAKNDINAVLTEEQKMAEFVLTISVDKNSKQQGDDFIVNIELFNNGEKDCEVATFILFQWFIQDWLVEICYDMPEHPVYITINKGDKYQATINIPIEQYTADTIDSVAQPSGQYELKVKASFYTNYGNENQQDFEIWSNLLILNVLEK